MTTLNQKTISAISRSKNLMAALKELDAEEKREALAWDALPKHQTMIAECRYPEASNAGMAIFRRIRKVEADLLQAQKIILDEFGITTNRYNNSNYPL